jgi:glycosyltransferase
MKISVVTVAYNSAATIADTLYSVAAQQHQPIEHIVVDGASTDGTPGIVAARGTQVSRLLSEPDRGIYDAMNKGLQLASGDAVGFLNADDLFADATVVARVAAAFAGPQQPDVVYGDLVYVSNRRPDHVVRHWTSGEFRPERLRFGWMPPHPTFYMRRSLLDAVGGFDTSLHIAADYDLMMRCLTRPGIRAAYVPQVLVRMRLGGASNRSIAALLTKSREDLTVIRRHSIGNLLTLASKNLRKLSQFAAPNAQR